MIRTINSILGKQRKPALLITQSRKVIFSNRFARGLVSESTIIDISDGKLMSIVSESHAELKRMLKLVDEQSTPKTLFWVDPSFILPIRIDILPILDSLDFSDNRESYFIVLLATSYLGDPELSMQFKDNYGLTPTELDLVRVLLKGLTLKEIAEQKDRATSTIKWTLSNIYEKTDTCSQRQLISLAELFVE